MIRTVVIVADAPGFDLAPYQSLVDASDLVIAADGAARHLLGGKRLPDLAVGDFDSLPPNLLAQLEQDGVAIDRHPSQKDETDLELALLHAVRHDPSQIYVLGALGGRPDMHLANLDLLLHPALLGRDVRILDRGWEIVVVHQEVIIRGQPGDIVSLLPMTETVDGITTAGLHYALHDEPLHRGPARGVSNVLEAPEASVTVRRGALLLMHQVLIVPPELGGVPLNALR